MKHLGLKPNGQPVGGGYYLRFISRAYEIELPKLVSDDQKLASMYLSEASIGKLADDLDLYYTSSSLGELPKLVINEE